MFIYGMKDIFKNGFISGLPVRLVEKCPDAVCKIKNYE